MSLIKSFSGLTIQTRTIASKSLHPKKFTSILDKVPVRPRSAWQIYFTENMRNFKDPNGKTMAAAASKKLSEQWKRLSDSEKQVYQDKYVQNSKAHYEALEKALNNATPLQFFEENKLRKKYNLPLLKDPKQPKRPKNGFLFYLEHLRSTRDPLITNNDVKTQVVEAARQFKALSPDQAKVYQDKAALARQDFQAKNAQYQELLK